MRTSTNKIKRYYRTLESALYDEIKFSKKGLCIRNFGSLIHKSIVLRDRLRKQWDKYMQGKNVKDN